MVLLRPGGWVGGHVGEWVLAAGAAFDVGQRVAGVAQKAQVALRCGLDPPPGGGRQVVLVGGEDEREAEDLARASVA